MVGINDILRKDNKELMKEVGKALVIYRQIDETKKAFDNVISQLKSKRDKQLSITNSQYVTYKNNLLHSNELATRERLKEDSKSLKTKALPGEYRKIALHSIWIAPVLFLPTGLASVVIAPILANFIVNNSSANNTKIQIATKNAINEAIEEDKKLGLSEYNAKQNFQLDKQINDIRSKYYNLIKTTSEDYNRQLKRLKNDVKEFENTYPKNIQNINDLSAIYEMLTIGQATNWKECMKELKLHGKLDSINEQLKRNEQAIYNAAKYTGNVIMKANKIQSDLIKTVSNDIKDISSAQKAHNDMIKKEIDERNRIAREATDRYYRDYKRNMRRRNNSY